MRPPAWTVLLLVPVTLVSFFAIAVLWGGLAPAFIPALRGNERLITLTGFFPIELIGVLGPALLAAKLAKVDFKAVFPFRMLPAFRVFAIVLATVGLALVITYLQAWFARATGWPYPKEIGELIRAKSPSDWVLLVSAVAIMPAFAEEVVTRGYIQASLLPRFGLFWGILLTTAVFALLHLTPAGIPTYVVLGVWLSWVRHRTGSLVGNIAAHVSNNLLAILQANFVPEAFWAPNAVWILPLGCLMVAGFGYLALRGAGNARPALS